MAANPNVPTPPGQAGAATEEPQIDWKKRLMPLVIVGALLLIGLVVFLIMQKVDREADVKPWEQYFEIQEKWAPSDAPRGNDTSVAAAAREEFIGKLQKFLAMNEGQSEGPLVPQIRWRIAKTIADHILAMRLQTEFSQREKWYDEAIAQLKAIRDEHPQYPLNWDKLSPRDYPSFTRKFLEWFEKNRAWDEKHLPREKEPDGKHTIVLRTTRGDIRMKLYVGDAPTFTKQFLERAIRGTYDGTVFLEKINVGDLEQPRQHAFRGGSLASRGLTPYAKDAHVELSTRPTGGGLLPEASRHRIPFTRGIVSAWHPAATEYDDPVQLMFTVSRSPQNDHSFTPIGKVVDEASLATLDRIYEQAIWKEDIVVREEDGDTRNILDWFQAPPVIKKVLVYDESGQLVKPETPSTNRAEPTDKEGSLAGLEADAYITDVPERPKPPEDEGAGDDNAGEGDKPGGDGEGGDGEGGEAGDGAGDDAGGTEGGDEGGR